MFVWRAQEKKGWSFVEILAVTAVCALLMTMGFVLYGGMREAARISTAEARLAQISTGLELYFQKYHSFPPQGCDLAVELAPFVSDPEVFINPLRDETAPGWSIKALYKEPDLSEIDRPGQYVTAMISDDGHTVVVLKTGHSIVRKSDLEFDPDASAEELLALLDPSEQTHLNGLINLNPNNSDDFEFEMTADDGSTITRDDLHDGTVTEYGTAEEGAPATMIRFKPKGNGNQNALTVDEVAIPVQNGSLYTITSDNMTVHLYNDHANGNGNGNGNGKAMGKWWIRIEAKDAEITCDGNGPPAEPPADDGVGVDVGGLGF